MGFRDFSNFSNFLFVLLSWEQGRGGSAVPVPRGAGVTPVTGAGDPQPWGGPGTSLGPGWTRRLGKGARGRVGCTGWGTVGCEVPGVECAGGCGAGRGCLGV